MMIFRRKVFSVYLERGIEAEIKRRGKGERKTENVYINAEKFVFFDSW